VRRGAAGARDRKTIRRHWKFSSLLYSAERGDTQYKFHPITEEEAMRIVDRIRRESTASG
jgi:hypothetical protein